MTRMVDTKLRGSAGEFLVCGLLAQFHWAAALTRDGIAMTDVLAQHAETGEAISIQVKTNWVLPGFDAKWQVGAKDVRPATSTSQWYVLVKLEGAQAPARARFFIIPKDHAAAGIWIAHHHWLTDPTAAPGKRNTPVSRAIVGEATFAGYEDRWDLLGTPTDQVPVLLPPWLRDTCQLERVGLPEGHPWRLALPTW